MTTIQYICPTGSQSYFKDTRLILNIIYVWKLNHTVLELDFRAVKFLFFPRRDLNPHHCYTAAPFAIYIYIDSSFLVTFKTFSFSWFGKEMRSIFNIYVLYNKVLQYSKWTVWGRRGHDRMVVGFIYAIGAYHHWRCEFEPCSCKVCSIQHSVIKLVSGFLRVLRFPPPIKLTCRKSLTNFIT